LIFSGGVVLERYEYDAYGDCHVLEPNYADDPDGKSDYGNPYLFTGRRVDILDNGSLTIQYNRNRYYDYYAGRWTTHDPLGYVDAMNLYEYAGSAPTAGLDALGLMSARQKAKAALRLLDKIHTGKFGYRYYGVSGLKQLINNRLIPLLSWVTIADYKGSEGASYDPKKRRLSVNIDPKDLKSIWKGYQAAYKVFHESIHVYNHKNKIVVGSGLFDMYKDEGMAYGGQFMAQSAEMLQQVEDVIFRLGNKKVGCEVIDELEGKWARAWNYINKTPRRIGLLPSWVVALWKGFIKRRPGLKKNEFYINESNIWRVRNDLGFKLSCREIAATYNDWIKDKMPCIKFSCRLKKVEPGEISLEKMKDPPLYPVFR
jgi:RHS repeat-associated protein